MGNSQQSIRRSLEQDLERLKLLQQKRVGTGQLEQYATRLKSVGTSRLQASPAGQLAVKVVGLGDPGGQVLPLGGLRVTLQVGQAPSEEALTDTTGYALLPMPEGEARVTFLIQVLAPDGSAVLTQKGKLVADAGSAGPLPLYLEVGYVPSLEPAFARGRTWHAAVEHALDQVASARREVEEALAREEARLTRGIQRLENAMKLASTRRGKEDKNG